MRPPRRVRRRRDVRAPGLRAQLRELRPQVPRQHRSVYFAERMAERLSGIDGADIEITHTAKQYWPASLASESRDIIFQEELG